MKKGKLSDFVLVNSTLEDALELSDNFWSTNRQDPTRSRLLFGIVNSLHFSQYPNLLDFERPQSPGESLTANGEVRIGRRTRRQRSTALMALQRVSMLEGVMLATLMRPLRTM